MKPYRISCYIASASFIIFVPTLYSFFIKDVSNLHFPMKDQKVKDFQIIIAKLKCFEAMMEKTEKNTDGAILHSSFKIQIAFGLSRITVYKTTCFLIDLSSGNAHVKGNAELILILQFHGQRLTILKGLADRRGLWRQSVQLLFDDQVFSVLLLTL